LKDLLLSARPDYGWLSEETADSAERLQRQRVWIVDPIDGTNSFVEDIPEFVISVGLVEDGRAVAGVIHNPATGEVYEASEGGGAYLGGRQIRVARPPQRDEPWRLLGSRTEISTGALDEFQSPWSIVPLGSTAYRMVKVADGTGHAFSSRGRKFEWDLCAAGVIVREAGGLVAGGDGKEIPYNSPVPEVQGVIAACTSRLPPPLAGVLSGRSRQYIEQE
jgi:myo-inositol-1(or 4)-monophosphatase